MHDGIPKRNPSYCSDPTAHDALTAIMCEQDALDQKVKLLIKTIKCTVDLAGFDLLARVELQDRRTGKTFR